jgi:hypothetical protein
MINNHWHSIIRHDSQPLAKHCTTWFTTTGTTWLAIIHNHWRSITQHDSQPLAQYNSPWFTTTSANEWKSGCECCASECESWWAMHKQWLWIMRYAEPVVCESWCAMLYQCSWIMERYAQLVVVNHGELYWASGWESCCVMLRLRLW